MLVFEGKGPVIPLIIVSILGGTGFFHKMMRDNDLEKFNGLITIVGMLACAVILYVVGRSLGRDGERVLLDPETHAPVTIRRRHAFFGTSCDTWAYVIGGLAIYMLVHALFTGTLLVKK